MRGGGERATRRQGRDRDREIISDGGRRETGNRGETEIER